MLLKGKKNAIATPCVSSYRSKYLERRKTTAFSLQKDAVVLIKRERK